jgi:hypothetical protein
MNPPPRKHPRLGVDFFAAGGFAEEKLLACNEKRILASSEWWRRRDSNPGRSGYEPLALTN